MKKKLGFKNFYTYTAASPKEGCEFSLLLPYVNTNCMNMFLEYMSKMLDNEVALLVMDQAGWHKSKDLLIPNNIRIIYLPPYSPELNPVERLWQYMKDSILKNKVYESLEILEQEVSNFINNLTCDVIKSVCNVNYLSSYL